MTTHADKGINTPIVYNFLNLPVQIVKDGVTTEYLYRADGTKLKKSYGTGKVTDYLDGFQYELENGVAKLQFVPTSEGYYDFVKNLYIYNYVDHLGNTRLSYTKNSAGVLEILEENNYYPFGLKHSGYNNIRGANPSYQYKYQGQELQETGWYSFKWRNYMPDIGRFFNVDPLAAKYPYNSTYAIQENKMGMGVELEGLELLKNHTGYFAIHGNAMKVVRAPASQRDSRGNPTFTAGNIGLTTTGYNPNARAFSQGGTGYRINEYKYNGPLPSAAEMQDTTDKISNKDRQSFTTTKTKAEMWNLKQVGADRAINAADGIKEIKNLVDLITNLPNLFDSNKNHVQAVNDVQSVNNQAITMDQAIQTVDQSGVTMDQQTRNDVVNYVFDGTLPNPDGGLMPNSNVITIGTQIMKDNKINIQPLKEQLNTK